MAVSTSRICRRVAGLGCKELHVPSQVIQQHIRQVMTEPVSHDDPQHRQVFEIFGEGISRENPSTVPEPFGEIEDGKIGGLLELDGKHREITTFGQQLERPQFGNLS